MEEEKQDAGTGHLYEDRNVGECIRCAEYVRWVHAVCAGMEEYFVVILVRDKYCLVLSLYPLCL
jgi:hypothetical protein